ncbi:hypothetical protein OG512_00725 [Streptomyces sp. NBC_01378]|uniref:Uncharacterized protein n=1 Tax=Streptomyces sp. NBC_00119 TaxID=2975659 RepID=A0AAU1ULZ5_9ACTN
MSSDELPEEPEQALPWRPEDGPTPAVRTWPYGGRPALFDSVVRPSAG